MHYINASATAFVNFLIKNSQEKHCNYLIYTLIIFRKGERILLQVEKKRHLLGPRQTGTAFIIWGNG